jgi:hypothetical protein
MNKNNLRNCGKTQRGFYILISNFINIYFRVNFFDHNKFSCNFKFPEMTRIYLSVREKFRANMWWIADVSRHVLLIVVFLPSTRKWYHKFHWPISSHKSKSSWTMREHICTSQGKQICRYLFWKVSRLFCRLLLSKRKLQVIQSGLK